MTMYYEGIDNSRRSPRHETSVDPFQALDAAVQERFGFGYQTYYMRRLIAAEHVLFAKRQVAMTNDPREKARHYESARRWIHLLSTYCQEDLLEQELNTAMLLDQEWMNDAQRAALQALDSYWATRS